MTSSRILIRGAVLALVAAVLAVTGGALGIDTLWPVLLAAAIGLSAVPLSAGRAAAFVSGTLVSWLTFTVRVGLLPDTVASQAVVVVLGIALVTAIAATTADLAPLWAGLAGYVAFAALYEPVHAAGSASLLGDSAVALVTVLLATAFGFGAALLGDLLTMTRPSHVESALADGEVA